MIRLSGGFVVCYFCDLSIYYSGPWIESCPQIVWRVNKWISSGRKGNERVKSDDSLVWEPLFRGSSPSSPWEQLQGSDVRPLSAEPDRPALGGLWTSYSMVVTISLLFNSWGIRRKTRPPEGFYFSLKMIYQVKLPDVDFLCKRKLGFPVGFGDVRSENMKDKAGLRSSEEGRGGKQLGAGWASLIARFRGETPPVNSLGPLCSTPHVHRACCKIQEISDDLGSTVFA